MKEKNKNRYDIFEFDMLDERNNVASATECTGLIQIPPKNVDEAKAYSEIYVVPEQVNDLKLANKPKGREIKSAPDK